MRRLFVLGAVLAVGALSMVVSGQAPAAPSKEAMATARIEKVKDNLYVITGSDASAAKDALLFGGNTAVFITDAGVTLVDTKLPGFGPMILERIKTITDKPVTRIINTHTHGDHTGGNGFFGASVESIVHENARTSMMKMPEFSGANAQFLPKRTYKDKLTVGSGKDQIDLYHFGRGHTNGDTFVVFTALRTMHAGDMFPVKALPYVDTANGGSVSSTRIRSREPRPCRTSTRRAGRPPLVSTSILRLSKTAHRSIDSCRHHHCVECSHQKPQLRSPRACRLHNSSVEAAAVKTSKGARRWERSSGSIAEPAGICGPNQQERRKSLSRVQSTWSAPMHPLSILDLYWSIRGEVACDDHAPEVDDPRWITEGWEPVPISSGHIEGTRYRCQHCASDGRAVTRYNAALH